MNPLSTPLVAVKFATGAGNIEDVLVDGKPLYRIAVTKIALNAKRNKRKPEEELLLLEAKRKQRMAEAKLNK